VGQARRGIASRQADDAASDDKTRADALQRLGLLYTEKVEDSGEGDRSLAAACSRSTRTTGARRTRSRSSTSRKRRWEDLEQFYRSSRNKIDEYIRVLEREVEAGDEKFRLSLADARSRCSTAT
jgi:hypothetical protein